MSATKTYRGRKGGITTYSWKFSSVSRRQRSLQSHYDCINLIRRIKVGQAFRIKH